MDTKINVNRTNIIISPYNEDNRDEALERKLSVWNKGTYQNDPIAMYYDAEKEELRITRSVSVRELENIFSNVATVYKDYDKHEKAIMQLYTKPRDDVQKGAIAFLLAKEEYTNLETHSRLMLELDTGVGKTYCVIAAISHQKTKSAIILGNKGLIDQWFKKLQEFTDLNKYDIVVISGSDSIKRLMDGEYARAKVFLVSHRTIQVYAKNNGWESITKVFKKMKISIKVFDEAHLELANVIKIDLFTNTMKTYYLTATAKRSAYSENRLFKTVYGPVPVLQVKRSKEEAYVESLVLMYETKPSFKDLGLLKNKYGLDSNKYMDYTVFGLGEAKFFKALSLVINTVIKKNDGQLSILLSRRNAVKAVADFIKNNYPEYKKEIGIYTSDVVGKENREKQLQKKFILTTFKSFGTGMDIPGLRYLIMAEPYSSKVTLEQTIGRLRDIGGEVFYFEIVDNGVPSRFNQFNSIKKRLLSLSKRVTTYNIP